MFVMQLLFWILLFAISYIAILFVLFKGKQYNRYFGTFISTIVPIIGSVPAFVMACKYEKRIGSVFEKIKESILKYVLVAMQLLSVVMLFVPFFKDGTHWVTGINLIFGKSTEGNVISPTLILIYTFLFPIAGAAVNFFLSKNNISKFVSYTVSLINILSFQLLNLVMASNDVSVNVLFWVYLYLNLAIMCVSIVAMIVNRDKALFKIEYKEKIEYIKEHKKKEEKSPEKEPDKKMYKCAKCGNFVPKGTICPCIEKKAAANAEPAPEGDSALKDAHGFCVYCKRPLAEGEKCNCQGDGFGITVKNEESKNRKCIYCGQVLVGESTCVCEKIMKNSEPSANKDDDSNKPKKYFESQVEKSSNIVADELAELEKKINSKFELVKENMELSGKN